MDRLTHEHGHDNPGMGQGRVEDAGMGAQWPTPLEMEGGSTGAGGALRADARPLLETAEEGATTQGSGKGGGSARNQQNMPLNGGGRGYGRARG